MPCATPLHTAHINVYRNNEYRVHTVCKVFGIECESCADAADENSQNLKENNSAHYVIECSKDCSRRQNLLLLHHPLSANR